MSNVAVPSAVVVAVSPVTPTPGVADKRVTSTPSTPLGDPSSATTCTTTCGDKATPFAELFGRLMKRSVVAGLSIAVLVTVASRGGTFVAIPGVNEATESGKEELTGDAVVGTAGSDDAVAESTAVTATVVCPAAIVGGSAATDNHTFFAPSLPHTCVFLPCTRTAPSLLHDTALAEDFTVVNHTKPVDVEPHTWDTLANFLTTPTDEHGVPATDRALRSRESEDEHAAKPNNATATASDNIRRPGSHE